MKIEELIRKDIDFINNYRNSANYLEIVKQQGTYETYTSWYIYLKNDQYQRVFNKDKYQQYIDFETFFKEQCQHCFQEINTFYISSKEEIHFHLKFLRIYSRDINEQANIGFMFGQFLMKYPNFEMKVHKDGFIILDTIIDLYDIVKIKDHHQMLDELKYRSELLRNIDC
ncbi:hypothetical protein [Tannockella kyphosi]|uniref:hypothetical protein n=1 Tax=Tannockella kyphosi TaxID=2899121 RepID=UPI0020125C6F|nr:hypothetical protein [Tannockella kyphosi]